jgi:hypothetical protein
MKKLFITIYIAATALPSMLFLVTSRNINNPMLLGTLIANIGSFAMIFYIQPIGWNICYYCWNFILFNNLFLIIARILYLNLANTNKFKEFIGRFLGLHLKIYYIFPIYLMRLFSTFITINLNILNNRITNLLFDLIVVEPLKLIEKHYDEESRHNLLTFENNKLLDHRNLFIALFAALCLEEEFTKEGKKIMIVSISKDDKTFYIHKNIIIIDENTTMQEYLNKIEHNIHAFYESGYPITAFNILEVKLWDYKPNVKSGGKKAIKNNTIHKSGRSFHSSCLNLTNLNQINPLKTPKTINKALIATIDLETIEINNNQIPISISFSYLKDGEIVTIFELIDYELLKLDPLRAVNLLWLNFMDRVYALNLHKIVIFSHNLGSFDGYCIFKGLLDLPNVDINKVNSIIDELHRFISIDITWKDTKLIFKDSLRIFPVSLQELCKVFEVEGKLFSYNPKFNKFTLFEDIELLENFIEYSKQDSICLLKALTKAQDIYIKEHKVDMATVWSTSTLAFKIFRRNFLDINIPTLTNKLDNLIRLAYLGGSTDYYFKYGEHLKHYDVKSLYPKAMCNPMPIEFLGESLGSEVRLEDVFGFAEAKITAPDDISVPLLPFKIFNETLHPLGTWIGIYFTEELKAAAKFGYKVDIIKVYHFSKADLFSKYIEYFYNIKMVSTGAMRFIAKMFLNQLYGYFGRRKTLIITKNVYKEDLNLYYGSYSVFSEIVINKDVRTILMSSNLDYDLINEIKSDLDIDLIYSFRKVKSNFAIAAAVTSYARIEMMKYKIIPNLNVFYTDTDSIFVDKELPKQLIGNELGQMKDELKGGFIDKAYFLGIKNMVRLIKMV